MKCPICKKTHKNEQHPHYKLMAELYGSSFPVETPEYLKIDPNEFDEELDEMG